MISINELKNIKLVCFDFDGVFTDNFVDVDEKGTESVRCFRSDGIGIARLKKADIAIYIVSTEVNPVVSSRAKKLDIPVMQAVKDKGLAMQEICKELNVSNTNAMFVGNDINDIPAFKFVKYPIGVADSFPEIDQYIIHKTKNKGGKGAVREICDMIINGSGNFGSS